MEGQGGHSSDRREPLTLTLHMPPPSSSLQQEQFTVFSLNLARPLGPYWQSRA